MTENELQQMQERKAQAYKRRLRAVRDKYRLPALSMRETDKLVTQLCKVQGDAVTESGLRVLHALTSRGLLS